MGKLETESKKISRKSKLQEAILMTLASGGRRNSSLLPTVAGILLEEDFTPRPRVNEYVKTAAVRLVKKGFVKVENDHYMMTKEGQNIWEKWQREDFKLKRPKKWDRKWRIIIFDIPERKKIIRNKVREILYQAGFERLQDSVWVYPYDCEDVIGLLNTEYGIDSDLLYIIADQIENDKYLRMDFDLASYSK